ncbi:beta-glucuronidase [Coraliomargarita algicola]|uniref:Beta-glucuronidase n=1 Tax=Coraliomargarita algicola TaxID=3092156 RepID=A0ABZ0RHY3_9BACT|nr:beta-glucuronidase [Coraliomargarita sp. J2-16]WPJ95804.1 beta-glucuronidase [Coraliomargarita sp. J2-16]
MLVVKQNQMRQAHELSGFFRFKADRNACSGSEAWENGLVGDVHELAVPGSWNEQARDLHDFFGEGWYEREFTVPDGWQGQRVWLRIGSTAGNARVWLDGHLLGQHRGPHLPFEFELTAYVRYGETQRLSIAVDNTLVHYDLPPGQARSDEDRAAGQCSAKPDVAYDFFPSGGIHRPVWLYTTGAAKIESLQVATNFQGTQGHLHLRTTVCGEGAAELQAVVDGKRYVFPVDQCSVFGECVIENVRLWSPEDPHLYQLELQLVSSKCELLDYYTQAVGVRTIRVEGHSLLLNDQPIFLRGVGKHEDFPVIGKGWMPSCVVRDFDLMRWMGANSFRTTHYPYAEEMLDYADRHGMLVIAETPFVGLKEHLYTDDMLARAQDTIEEMIVRDYNHPSVILWSMANEPNVRSEAGRTFFKGMADKARSMDATRPIMFVAHQWPDNNLGAEFYDMIGVNKYYGWYSDPGDIDGSLQKLIDNLEAFNKEFDCPVMLAEFGADAVAGIHSDPPAMFTEEYQAQTIEKQYNAVKDLPWMVGTHVWAFADFKTQQSYTRVNGNRKGLFTRNRHPKMAAHTVRRLWTGQ